MKGEGLLADAIEGYCREHQASFQDLGAIAGIDPDVVRAAASNWVLPKLSTLRAFMRVFGWTPEELGAVTMDLPDASITRLSRRTAGQPTHSRVDVLPRRAPSFVARDGGSNADSNPEAELHNSFGHGVDSHVQTHSSVLSMDASGAGPDVGLGSTAEEETNEEETNEEETNEEEA